MTPTEQTGTIPAEGEARPLGAYHARVEVQSVNGDHVRYVPGALAEALVDQGTALAGASSGRVRSVVLVRSATAYAKRTGEAEGRATGVRFYRWAHLEASARRVIEHHPRCLYEY